MRKFTVLLLILAMVFPLAIPMVAAQGNGVQARLEDYDAHLPKGYGNISVVDLSTLLIDYPDVTLVDVRQPEEYADGHIAGAVNIPLRELAQHLDWLPDLDAQMVVYCGSGFRSAIAMTSLQILGYTDVKSMSGGVGAWKAEEYALTTNAPEPVAGTAPDIDPALLTAVDTALMGIPQGWGAVKAEDLSVEMIENPPDLLIDVRTPDEWAQGYIAGAVHMPLDELMSFVDELPQDMGANIVVYCKSGHRGNMAATMLRVLGYTNVRNLSGGIGAWTTAGLPIETPKPEAEAFDVIGWLNDYFSSLPQSFNAVKVADLSAELAENPDLLLVDVRTVDEYDGGHIEGAINIPLNELTDHLDLLPNLDQNMVVYCGSGHRSAIAMMSLNLLGYVNTRSMLGGVKAWTSADMPLAEGETVVEAGTTPAIDPQVFDLIDAYVKSIQAGYYAISAENLNVAIIENPPMIYDVRFDSELTAGFIADSIHIPLPEWAARASEWPADKDMAVVVYCGSGHRSAMAMVAMQLAGYTNVKSLSGGWKAWVDGGYPVATN
jgi:rhodanese-related sulfurtransferase